MRKGIVYGLLLAALGLAAQPIVFTQNTIVGAGYEAPAPVSAAPGQVITVFVQGLNTGLVQPLEAPSGDALPISLGGVTATLQQGGSAISAPILEIRPLSTCPSGGAATNSSAVCATLTAVTLQIPYELVPLCPLCLRPVFFPPPWLYVSYQGQAGSAIELNALADQVHILTSCDVLLQPAATPLAANITGLPCAPMVTHADGTMVSATTPAKPGETLIAWTTGLGATNPAATTGKPSPKPLPTAETLGMTYTYTLNSLAAKPGPTAAAPVYSGLAPGFAGLYQINFVTPPEPANGSQQCAPGVQSNLTVSFGGGYSFDGAGICVATHVPVD